MSEFDEKDFDESQENVVDSQMEDVQDDAEDMDSSDDLATSEEPEVADPEHGQSKEENSKFASIRRKAEEEAKQKYERELQVERDRLEAERTAFYRQVQEQNAIAQQQQQLNDELESAVLQIIDEDPSLSEATARRMARYELDRKQEQQREQQRQYQARVSQQKGELQSKPFFKDLEPEIDRMIQLSPGLDVRTAYNYLRGERMEDLMEQAKKNTQQRTIADLHDQARRGVVSSDSGSAVDVDPHKTLTPEGLAMARAFGNDPKAIAKYVVNSKKRR